MFLTKYGAFTGLMEVGAYKRTTLFSGKTISNLRIIVGSQNQSKSMSKKVIVNQK